MGLDAHLVVLERWELDGRFLLCVMEKVLGVEGKATELR